MNPLRPRTAAWQQVCDWYKIRDGYWFAPKLYGFGATPVRWQGWASIAALLLMAAGTTWLGRHYGPGFYALLVPLVLGFIALCWAKTDGEWKWRSGTGQGS